MVKCGGISPDKMITVVLISMNFKKMIIEKSKNNKGRRKTALISCNLILYMKYMDTRNPDNDDEYLNAASIQINEII
jgi:hypothetical protein